jgi:hypothetical protein
MNGKLVLAFVAGVLATAGIFYFPKHMSQPAPVAAEAPPPVVSLPEQHPAPIPDAEAPKLPIASKPASAPKPRAKDTKPAATPATRNDPEPTPVAAATPPPTPTTPPVATTPPPPPAQVEDAPKERRPLTPPEPPKPHVVTLDAGTLINVRIDEPLASDKNKQGDTFRATLEQPIVVDGFVIAERGSRAEGRVAEVEEAGRVKGVAKLGIELTKFTTADGQEVDVHTARFFRDGETSKKQDAAKVGIGSAIGAAIGAIAGGGKGAGIGAATGGAAGGGVVLATRGKPATLASETKISFRLDEPVTVTERLRSSR